MELCGSLKGGYNHSNSGRGSNSIYATAGVYGFSKAKYFFDGLDKMKSKSDKVHGEYYVERFYTDIVFSKGPNKNSYAGNVNDVLFGLGTPEDYEFFLKSAVFSRAQQEALNIFGGYP
jgi:hypothetical protein